MNSNAHPYNKLCPYVSIRDTPNWKENPSKHWRGVHFDIRCDIHNVEYLNIPAPNLNLNDILKCCKS